MNGLVLWLWALLAAANMVWVHVQDDAGRPVEGVRVVLYLYDIQEETAYEIPIGSCRTDAEGDCSISVPDNAPRDAAGMFRGSLQVGDLGRRSLIWPGGKIYVEINVDRVLEGRESAPLGADQGMGLKVRPGWHRYLGWIWLGLALGMALLGWYWRRYR